MSPSAHDLLRTAIEPIVARGGLDLEELDVTLVGRRRRVRVVVDTDGGVDLDRCAELSQTISAALDDSNLAGDAPYALEVSSPGVSRPLTQPRHWRRNVGRLVRVKRAEGGEVTGRVTDAGDDEAVLNVDGQPVTVSYSGVATAKVQVEFRRDEGQGR